MRNSMNLSPITTSFRAPGTRHFFQRGSATRQWHEGDECMNGIGQATTEIATRYFDLFVNRLAYILQSHKPNGNGKHYYYRPRNDRRLSPETVREHLNGQITIGIYALNPKTQRSKWVAI